MIGFRRSLTWKWNQVNFGKMLMDAIAPERVNVVQTFHGSYIIACSNLLLFHNFVGTKI